MNNLGDKAKKIKIYRISHRAASETCSQVESQLATDEPAGV
jgi:hypothetical protein